MRDPDDNYHQSARREALLGEKERLPRLIIEASKDGIREDMCCCGNQKLSMQIIVCRLFAAAELRRQRALSQSLQEALEFYRQPSRHPGCRTGHHRLRRKNDDVA